MKGFPGGASSKEPACQCRLDGRDAGLIPGSERSPGGGQGNPLQYSCLENPTDRGTWQAAVHKGRREFGHNWSDLAHTHRHTHSNKQNWQNTRPPKRQLHFQEGTQEKCIHKKHKHRNVYRNAISNSLKLVDIPFKWSSNHYMDNGLYS